MAFAGDSIYWVEVEKVVPNPFQPRREFDESKLRDLAESIRMYGVLQPLTVTRKEIQREDGTFYTEYELIAGERRLRASKLAGTAQVPVIIREGEDSEQEKLELAIIENLQREDLNAIDRALAFAQLAEQFELTHTQVAQKVGRSREYVANSIRLLNLPEHMRLAVQRGELGEGHARTLLMLTDKPEEQEVLFRETLLKKLSVRELERIARKIASDKVRKPHKEDIDAHLIEIEKAFTETLGTRVQILKTDFGGKLTIDYFSEEDLDILLQKMKEDGVRIENAPVAQSSEAQQHEMVNRLAAATPLSEAAPTVASVHAPIPPVPPVQTTPAHEPAPTPVVPAAAPKLLVVGQTTPVTPTPAVTEPPAPDPMREFAPAPTPEESVQHTPEPAPVLMTQPEREEEPEPESATPAHFAVAAESSNPLAQPAAEKESDDNKDDNLYSISNFTV